MKGIQNTKEEVRLSVFEVNIIIYIQKTLKAQQNLLELINEFSKTEDTKSTYKNQPQFYKQKKKKKNKNYRKRKLRKSQQQQNE